MANSDDMVLMATIGAPHGVRGELRAKPYSDNPLALGKYGALSDMNGRTYTVKTIRSAKNVVVMRLSGVDTREAAEKLKGVSLYVARDCLPDDDLDNDEFYQADLIGLDTRDAQDKTYGKVSAIHNFGGGDILELAVPGKRSVMIPFSETSVLDIDLEAGIITLEPVAAGLTDTDDEPGPGSRRRRPASRAKGDPAPDAKGDAS